MTVNLPENWTINLAPKNGTWQFYIAYYDQNHKRRQKYIDTKLKIRGNKRNAEAMEQDILNEWIPILMKKVGLMSGDEGLSGNSNNNPPARIPEDNRILVHKYLSSWLVANKIRYQTTTYSEYCRVFDRTIIPFFEPLGIYLDELKTKHIQAFYNDQIKKVSGNTVLRFHSYLHKALQDAVDDDEEYPYFQVNPASKTKRPQYQKYITKIYSKEDLAKLFSVIAHDFLFLVILLDSTYGMRRSELMGLKWNAVDFSQGSIIVKQAAVRCKVDKKYVTVIKPVLKNKSSFRSFEITPQVKAVLLTEKERQKANRKKYGSSYNMEYSDYIFVDDLGNLRDPNYVSDHFRRTLIKNKLKVIRFHDLRHTCAMLLLNGGLSLPEIQKYLGHGQLATTSEFYTHLDYSHQQKSSNIAGNIISEIQEIIPDVKSS